MRGGRAAALLLIVALLCGFPIPAYAQDQVIETELMVPGTPEADGKPVKLDATILTTEPATPRPAIVLAHGFGGTKADSEATARTLGPGSFYTEPASDPHFAFTGDQPAVVYITGQGPTDTTYVVAAHASSKQGE